MNVFQFMDFLKRLLHFEEGFNPKAHKVDGKWHVGYGHCLDQEQDDDELEVMSLDDELEDWEGFELTQEQCDQLFAIDVEDALHSVSREFTIEQLNALGEVRSSLILAMAFQMGSVRPFKAFRGAVHEQDWDKAAEEMLWSNSELKNKRSKWYLDTPERCQRASDAMRVGYFEALQEETDPFTEVRANIKASALSDFSNRELLIELAKRFNENIDDLPFSFDLRE